MELPFTYSNLPKNCHIKSLTIKNNVFHIDFFNNEQEKERTDQRGKLYNIEGEKYWVGPYHTAVPERINEVIAADGTNYLSFDGAMTQLYSFGGELGEETYRNRYTTKKLIGGKIYDVYDEEKARFFKR